MSRKGFGRLGSSSTESCASNAPVNFKPEGGGRGLANNRNLMMRSVPRVGILIVRDVPTQFKVNSSFIKAFDDYNTFILQMIILDDYNNLF